MNLVLYTNSVSAHELPLAREIVRRIGAENFRYVYTGRMQGGGQEIAASEPWIASEDETTDALLRQCDVLLSGNRAIDVFEDRSAHGKLTFYMSERWFKPIRVMRNVWVPGWLRMAVPGYRRMATRFAALLASDRFRYLPIGPWAAKDMVKMCRLIGRACPEKTFIPWGYFVEPSNSKPPDDQRSSNSSLKLLWVGRMLDWKRVDTIVKAVCALCPVSQAPNFHDSPLGGEAVSSPLQVERNASSSCPALTLTLVGDGPERARLERLARGLPVTFLPPQPIARIRSIMRAHDVYVLSSNAVEGWGAALNEAIEEGMKVLGTHEAGSSAALLPESCRFHAGDWRRLSRLLKDLGPRDSARFCLPADFTPQEAAKRLLGECEECQSRQ